MLKILLKTAILVFIILSVYIIVNPSACTNLMNGRVVNSTEKEVVLGEEGKEVDAHQELFTPVGDNGQVIKPEATSRPEPPASADGIVTPDVKAEVLTPAVSQQPAPTASKYSQADMDMACAIRYVELENEYAKENKLTQDAAKEISYKVMDTFKLSPAEWEAFVQRATQTNLFNKVRADMAVQKK